jgi:hypothetical protein
MAGKDDFGSILDEVLDGRHGGSNARIISDDQLVIQRHIEIGTDEHTLTLELRLTEIAHTLLPGHTNQGTITTTFTTAMASDPRCH